MKIKNLTKSTLSIYLLLFITLNAFSQPEKWKNKKYFTAVSYNVENLFDTINDPTKNDNEFTPNTEKNYNTDRYFKKIENISSVIQSINKNELPEIIGLVEVENKSVLKDLVASNNLKSGNYQIIIEEGPDPRGIDCAFLYRPDVFKYINHKTLPVIFPFANNSRTRDILYIKGMVHKDTLHVFVNHWSSRRGGAEKSEPKRIMSAKVLRENIDSILSKDTQAQILIMGDFNDEPSNASLKKILSAGKASDTLPMVNLMYEISEEGKGTYYYKGEYNMLDNFVVSKNLTTKTKKFRLYKNQGWIYKPEFICFTHKNGDKAPSRTYGGNNFYGGFSDHFPIYTLFYEK